MQIQDYRKVTVCRWVQVTVVDAAAVAAELEASEQLANRAMAAGPDDARTIADLIMDQIEFADTLILNKCDLVSQVWIN